MDILQILIFGAESVGNKKFGFKSHIVYGNNKSK